MKLEEVKLQGANLRGANLNNADWNGVTIEQKANLLNGFCPRRNTIL